MASEYRVASDGLPARESGEWAKEKLYYAERYMSIFNGAMHRKWHPIPPRGTQAGFLLQRYAVDSIDTPIHTFGGHGSCGP